MAGKESHSQDLSRLLDEWLVTGDAARLVDYLAAHSRLPGPRGNLELACEFADLVADLVAQTDGPRHELWRLCLSMSGIPPEQAPVNDPREFISFCGTLGLAAIGAAAPEFTERAMAALQRLANDPRWRMREGVCMGLQRLMASRSGGKVWAELATWVRRGSLLELRAVAAAVAEPPLLQDPERAMSALNIHRDILERLLSVLERKTEDFRVLRQGLGYTLSVVVHAAPQDGFEFMVQLAASGDPDVRWIVRENLKKKRLLKHYPEQVTSIMGLLQ